MDALVKSIAKEKIPIALIKVGKLDKNTIIKSSKWTDQVKDEFGKIYNTKYNTILYFNPSNLDEKLDAKTSKLIDEHNINLIIGNTIYSLISKYNNFHTSFIDTLSQKYPSVFNDLEMKINELELNLN